MNTYTETTSTFGLPLTLVKNDLRIEKNLQI